MAVSDTGEEETEQGDTTSDQSGQAGSRPLDVTLKDHSRHAPPTR
jgi:hypothetical protein